MHFGFFWVLQCSLGVHKFLSDLLFISTCQGLAPSPWRLLFRLPYIARLLLCIPSPGSTSHLHQNAAQRHAARLHCTHNYTVSKTNQPCIGSSSLKAAYCSCCLSRLDAGFQSLPLHVQGPFRGVSHSQQQWQQSVGSAADGM